MMFSAVLIANRGEIAVRVAAVCQELGLRTIAVYSEADRGAAHVRAADEAYCIGPALARDSYLDGARIIAVARAHGAQAIHPGYGFLSENAEFAAACAAAGIVFIGPPPAAIRLMGAKTAAKRGVAAAGVPVVPGYEGATDDPRTVRREAKRIGFPLMLKAAAGGGGRGMRVVRAAAELPEALAGARREALAAFGDDSVFLEKLIEAPRHIEFQILADQYGNVIHLGERDCSIQRRHQKVIEESPCVALTPALRAAMGSAAVAAARAAGYVNAGTCEFLLDRDGHFYFLEMNTRLQVEHPVTEATAGLDLVRHQLAIAAGEPLTLTQEHIASRGHAIEARIYAEDPAHGDLPSTGRVLALDLPRAPGVRVDAGIAAGDEVSVHYDALLAKLIVAAEDRATAIARLRWALDRCAVLGVATNIPLLRAIAAEPDFQAGRTSTAYLEVHDLRTSQPLATPPAVLAAAALWDMLAAKATPQRGPYNPWTSGTVRVAVGNTRRLRYEVGAATHIVDLTPRAGSYAVTVDSQAYPAADQPVVASLRGDQGITLDCGGPVETCLLARRVREVLVAWRGQSYTLAQPQPLDVEQAARGGAVSGGAQVLVAPMAGTILQVQVAEGEHVEAQQTLLVLGAMKMEHAITAPSAGHVRHIAYAAGDVVAGGAVLAEVDGSAESNANGRQGAHGRATTGGRNR